MNKTIDLGKPGAIPQQDIRNLRGGRAYPLPCGLRKTFQFPQVYEAVGDYIMDLRVNLKVCEGCGCLWYRDSVETTVYCSRCTERLKDFPTSETRRRRGRPKKISLPTVWAVAEVAGGRR